MSGSSALISNEATIFGLLLAVIWFISHTSRSEHPFWQRFYSVVPTILLCYFLPSLMTTFGLVDISDSQLYYVASRFLLPAALLLLTINVDLKTLFGLGPKVLFMFATGTVGIVIGGPIALLAISAVAPEVLNGNGPDAVWRGMTTVAGSWIGGGANQASMKEIYQAGDQIFSAWVTVDVLIGNAWLAILLVLSSNSKKLDAKLGSDLSAIEDLKQKMADYRAQRPEKVVNTDDLMKLFGLAFIVVAAGHWVADMLAPFFSSHYPELNRFSFGSKFFWMVVTVTTIGLALSFTKLREVENLGASKFGSLFIYILVATIGLKMDLTAVTSTPLYFAIGAVWMVIHASLMLLVMKLIKAPLFYMAVGSQANVGGAASAPIVAAAFHPSLAPIGVLLAVFGYVLGTYMAWFCGQVLQVIATS